ncbi:MAG: AAA family ATPase [bacterium]
MAFVVGIVNQKGGVGKTTTVVNLAGALAHLGKKVLVVDLDPQANATSGIGIEHRELEQGIYEALLGEKTLSEVVIASPSANLFAAPATSDLAGANVELISLPEREYRLKTALNSIRDDYDFIFIDSPPSLGLLTVNGLVAADTLLVPVQAEFYALEGLTHLIETVELVREHLKPDLDIMGAVVTMYDGRNNLASDVFQELKKFFPGSVFDTVIPRSVRLAEAPSHGKTIFEHDPYSKGAAAYEILAQEFLKKMGVGA